MRKKENKTAEEYIVQWKQAPLYLDKLEALQYLRNQQSPDARAVFIEALDHPFWDIRVFAISNWKFTAWKEDADLFDRLKTIAKSDNDSRVRSAALNKLGEISPQRASATFEDALSKERSLRVISTALRNLAKADSAKAMREAAAYEQERFVKAAVYDVYGLLGDASKLDFFESDWANAGNARFQWVNNYVDLLTRLNDAVLKKEGSIS